MRPLSRDQFEAMRLGATVLEQDAHGVKVLRLADGSFLKLFRRKSWFSKTVFFTPAQRFAQNATALSERNIPCPQVIDLFQMRSPYRSVVHYAPLPGDTLRHLLGNSEEARAIELLRELATFINTLHDKGVYFRSLHLGNIILTPQGELGLIDISDMRCLNRPLSKRLRARNYHHLLRYEQDWKNVSFEMKQLFSAH
ncbi:MULTISPECIES: lipopolysaccharide kinase InaA family protein [Pseudomonas]|mgnify:FL=1|uniref:Toluene tolerance protein n=1 Tax=Pseudomonas neustonica TaxID=2487346 RepID=A0ABX9XQ60_9PSED|nr:MULTISPECIES: lipopolysaccharide kinase InaA family protein [Pseudomonas]MBA6419732.1 toluene tolerance protein [Pseudomonas sp. 5Ae-yellow]ROZ87200.1 toluene tolerance protein [Pseudomonas sp. SSM44]ROZ88183.1 toluene tolerance protein [Pseudomonas neustonica]|tara:strand:+ start:899 stop:1489 length:591 start_codon:yes stop_codon:yes gene_type:complete